MCFRAFSLFIEDLKEIKKDVYSDNKKVEDRPPS